MGKGSSGSQLRVAMPDISIQALTPDTWPLFAALIERHGGVFGGCWCVGFHACGLTRDAATNRAAKEALVRQGRAHAALVIEDGRCLGWCQFGPVDELTRIKNRRAYEAAGLPMADWRITCFFVDRSARRRGIAERALTGALALIAAQGGGRVEAFPEDTAGRKRQPFLWGGSLSMLERAGFAVAAPVGKYVRVAVRQVAALS